MAKFKSPYLTLRVARSWENAERTPWLLPVLNEHRKSVRSLKKAAIKMINLFCDTIFVVFNF